MKIQPAQKLVGELRLPGDKSVSHRAALIGALAEGMTTVSNFGTSADCASTLACLAGLGVTVEREGGIVRIHGRGRSGLSEPVEELNCGNSGTTARLLAGILAGQEFTSMISGDASLCARPMRRVIEPLTRMGAAIRSRDGRLPLSITGSRPLDPIEYVLPVASAQVKSCVLFAGFHADGISSVTEPLTDRPGPVSRNHTELMLRAFGADIETSDSEWDKGFRHTVTIDGASRLEGRPVTVPGDISSAAFLIVAALCLEGSRLVLKEVGVNPTRAALLDVFSQTGGDILVDNQRTEAGEPIADISVRGGLEAGNATLRLSGSLIPNLIDEIPALAVLGTQLPGGLEVKDAAELRQKETDRIAAVVGNLRKMGAEAEEFDDGFRVGPSRLRGATVDSYGDHRIAMAFAVAALLADRETLIEGAECVNVSFPGFFGVLENVVS